MNMSDAEILKLLEKFKTVTTPHELLALRSDIFLLKQFLEEKKFSISSMQREKMKELVKNIEEINLSGDPSSIDKMRDKAIKCLEVIFQR
jgi:hypothetical protein